MKTYKYMHADTKEDSLMAYEQFWCDSDGERTVELTQLIFVGVEVVRQVHSGRTVELHSLVTGKD